MKAFQAIVSEPINGLKRFVVIPVIDLRPASVFSMMMMMIH